MLPSETWVTNSDPGRYMVSLQTCIENYGDYWTMGPNWYVRYVVRADRGVRGSGVATPPPDSLKRRLRGAFFVGCAGMRVVPALGLFLIYPLDDIWRTVVGEGVEQGFWLGLDQDRRPVLLAQESLRDHVVEESDKRVVVACQV